MADTVKCFPLCVPDRTIAARQTARHLYVSELSQSAEFTQATMNWGAKCPANRTNWRNDILASDIPVRDDGDRKFAFHVNFDDPVSLNYVLNNVENISARYKGKGTPVEIRIVAHGPGQHMFREDASPVKEQINELTASQDGLHFYTCSYTRERMKKAEGKTLAIMSVATMVPAGLVELIELSRVGWTYLKP